MSDALWKHTQATCSKCQWIGVDVPRFEGENAGLVDMYVCPPNGGPIYTLMRVCGRYDQSIMVAVEDQHRKKPTGNWEPHFKFALKYMKEHKLIK